jgi:exonuclease SbcD
MRLLHTSDWHIGRTFHAHPTLEHLRIVLAALIETVRERHVDVVLVAGDIFDSATPAAENYEVLTDALRSLREAGATVVLTSGNHDSATRLGFQSSFAALAGIHVITRPEDLATPVELTDEHGAVAIYGIPFLEPALVRHRLGPEASELRSHADVLGYAMDKIRADAAARAARSVVLAHCFAAQLTDPGVRAATEHVEQTPGLERDITAGGLDLVPLDTFDGPDYVALGHIHGRATLRPGIRYSGAPLHYTFSEADKPRGAWLVDLGADGLGAVEWIDLPVPRRLRVLIGPLEQLLADPRYAENERDWISAIITDQARPLDAMRKLQARFPWCATVEHRPEVVADAGGATTYAERVRAKSDPEIVGGFLEHVRNGVGPTDAELAVIAAVVDEASAAERVS